MVVAAILFLVGIRIWEEGLFYVTLWTTISNLVINGSTVEKLQHFIINPRWRHPSSCFRFWIKTRASNLIYIILCTPSSNFVIIGWMVQKLQHLFQKLRWRSPPFCGKESSYNNHGYIFGKGVHKFIIPVNVNCLAIFHSFFANRRNVVKKSVLTLLPPIQANF